MGVGASDSRSDDEECVLNIPLERCANLAYSFGETESEAKEE